MCHLELSRLLWWSASKKESIIVFNIRCITMQKFSSDESTEWFFFFFAALLDSEEKYVIWLDVYRILMKCFVISCQSRKSLWNGRVLHHSYSLGVGCLRPWIVWHSKSNFMSNLRVIRELVWSSLHDEESRGELWESNSWGERYCLLLFAL